MNRRYLLVPVALTFGMVPSLVHGCSTETAFESVCDWVADPNNCYREFRAGMLDDDAGPSSLEPGCTFPGTQPTQADAAKGDVGVPNGAFQTTGMLATCIMDSGGSVTVNPPINLAAYPPSLDSTPVTYTSTFLDPVRRFVRHRHVHEPARLLDHRSRRPLRAEAGAGARLVSAASRSAPSAPTTEASGQTPRAGPTPRPSPPASTSST